MNRPNPTLTLRRSRLIAAGGGPVNDDFEVWAGDQAIGRILLTPAASRETPRFWTITARVPQSTADRGYAAMREDAMHEFKAA